MALATEGGTAGVFARGGAHSLLSLAAIGLAATALVVTTLVVVTGAGLHAAGTSGSPGTTGATGATGAAGAGTTWGTLTFSFTMGGKSDGLAVTGSSCSVEGHGAYDCQVTVVSTSNETQKLSGLSYPANPNVYYAGADPTIGWIDFTPDNATTFTLWFQAVQTSGSSSVPVTLLTEPAPEQ